MKPRFLSFRALPILALLAVATGAHATQFGLTAVDKQRMQRESQLAIGVIQSSHFSRQRINQIPADIIIGNYLNELDSMKMFLNQADVDEIHARFIGAKAAGSTGTSLKPAGDGESVEMSTPLHDVYLKRGDLYPAFSIFEMFRDRALNRFAWVRQQLGKGIDLHRKGSFTADRTDLPWPKDLAASDELWLDRLCFEMGAEILNDQTPGEAREKILRRYARIEKFVNELDVKNVQELFLNSVATAYDPHTTYWSADTLEEFSNHMNNSFVGIGAALRDEDGYCVVQEIMPGSPAQKSGALHSGEIILEVQQEGETPVDVVGMKMKNIIKLIRGPEGSKVVLTISPDTKSGERRKVELVRASIPLTEQLASAKLYEIDAGGGRKWKIGVIDLPSFYGGSASDVNASDTSDDVAELLRKLKADGVDGVVLDLSLNGGGLLNEAIELVGLFIGKGPVVQVKDTYGRIRRDNDRDSSIAYDGPLVVLTSRMSASASEIAAGALKNLRRAVIVGDATTHGKGTVQNIQELSRALATFVRADDPKMGAAKVTIQKFYLPSGESTQHRGVTSDIILPSITMYMKMGESDLPRALPWDTIDTMAFTPEDLRIKPSAFVSDPLLNRLNEASAKRLKTLPELVNLARYVDWFRVRRERNAVALDIDARRSERDEEKRLKHEFDAERDRLLRESPPAKDVLLDVSQRKKAEEARELSKGTLPDGRPLANAFYQKVFYWQPEAGGAIRQVYLDRFDYEKLIDRSSADLGKLLAGKLGVPVSAADMSAVFNKLKNGDTVADFQVDQLIADQLKVPVAKVTPALPALLGEMARLDPRSSDRQAESVEIPLREALRVMADWLSFNAMQAGQSAASVAGPVQTASLNAATGSPGS